jgi:hypothetical protein
MKKFAFVALLLVCFTSSLAHAGDWSFSATTSGAAATRTINIRVNPSAADVSQAAYIYIAAFYQGQIFFITGTGLNSTISGVYLWSPGAPVPVFTATNLQSPTDLSVYVGDTAGLSGIEVWVGYGRTESDMLLGGKYARVYTFP